MKCNRKTGCKEQHIWFFLYEYTGDPSIRRQFDKTSGFCRYHGQLAVNIVRERELMTESSIARLYETVVMTYRELVWSALLGKWRSRASRLIDKSLGRPLSAKCMVCETTLHITNGNIAALLRMLGEEVHRSTYIESEGLCNHHLALAVQKAEANTRRFLLEDHERHMEEVQRRLFELQRKQSYVVQEKPTTEEQNAWTEAVWCFTGVSWDELLIKRGGCSS